MTLYLDSADRSALAPLLATGLFAGVTTNPLLLHRAGLDRRDLAGLHDWAVAAGAATVFLQATGTDPAAIAADARALARLSAHVVVKVTATTAGLTAARTLADEGVPVLVTAVYHATQALLAAAAGARFLAPYLGRMTDAGRDGLAQVLAMQAVLAGGEVEILVASIRSIEDVATLAAAGVPSFTLGPALAELMLADHLTTAAAREFEELSAGPTTDR